eukprot:CAMPEP_0119313428 /NCGR_PEP_ID=MMETSP1333-20130426/29088_1 /TAXON_ID=418940 /ORGANISM="Scyphosphaera apsteinii, Strain RCC1455" /LENGTH=88 /DNA_ID=CAMNT_0007318267 /DNA_START=280 /DNA_END=543 /DNA_ORIENTATION=+
MAAFPMAVALEYAKGRRCPNLNQIQACTMASSAPVLRLQTFSYALHLLLSALCTTSNSYGSSSFWFVVLEMLLAHPTNCALPVAAHCA